MNTPKPPHFDEFYVNYVPLPKGYRQFLLWFLPALVLSFLAFGLIFPGLHNQFNSGKIQGKVALDGFLVAEPAPQLIVPRPSETENAISFSRYLLSGPGKTAPRAKVMDQAGKWVRLEGTLVSRNQLSVIAARAAEAITPSENDNLNPDQGQNLGKFTLTGKILDSKCYPGVMKPGQGKTHRSCAICCLSGFVA